MAHVWRKKYKSRNRILDKFYTKQGVVKRCLDEVNKLPYRYDCVIEPSAGWSISKAVFKIYIACPLIW